MYFPKDPEKSLIDGIYKIEKEILQASAPRMQGVRDTSG